MTTHVVLHVRLATVMLTQQPVHHDIAQKRRQYSPWQDLEDSALKAMTQTKADANAQSYAGE